MPRPPTLKIHEIFASVQGEGLRQGEPTLFIRLSGCNLRCGFCDTREAWEGGRDLSIPDILEEARRAAQAWPADWACLTGGEPLLQGLAGLAAALKAEGFKLQIETNGTLFQPLPIDWWTVSPKPPEYRIRPELIESAREIKLVICEDMPYTVIPEIRNRLSGRTPILLQPDGFDPGSPRRAIDYLQRANKEGIRNIRLSIQMHKIYNLK